MFEFPEVVLDLDAEDSPHVRPVNEADWQREIDKHAVNPAVEAAAERVAQFEQESQEAYELMRSTANERLSMWQVSDMDVISVAIRGAPRNEVSLDASTSQDEQRQMEELSKVLRHNGITDRIMSQDDAKVIHFMMHRQNLAQSVNPFSSKMEAEKSSTTTGEVQVLKTALSRCGFYQMRRLVFRLAQSESGCHLLSQCGEQISKVCRQSQQDGMAEEVLIFVNDFTSNLQSRGLNIDEALCVAGLQASTIAAEAPAALRYIGLSQEIGYGLSNFSATDLQTALEGLLGTYSGTQVEPERTGWQAGHRPEAFSLLTGRGVASFVPQASLRARIGESMSFIRAYKSYVVLLGELGALRLLWHEWQILKTSKGQLAAEMQRGAKHLLFANALAHCATSLQSRRVPFVQEDYTTQTGDYAKDAALDLQCIRNQNRIFGDTSMGPPSSNHEDTAALAEQLQGQIRQVFRIPNIKDAMRSITALVSTTVAGK